jgi:hypothetical protein
MIPKEWLPKIREIELRTVTNKDPRETATLS